MRGDLNWADFLRCAREFAPPQIDIVKPLMVICLGRSTPFRAISEVVTGRMLSGTGDDALGPVRFNGGRNLRRHSYRWSRKRLAQQNRDRMGRSSRKTEAIDAPQFVLLVKNSRKCAAWTAQPPTSRHPRALPHGQSLRRQLAADARRIPRLSNARAQQHGSRDRDDDDASGHQLSPRGSFATARRSLISMHGAQITSPSPAGGARTVSSSGANSSSQ